MNKELTIDDLKIIFDVLNVYDPNDISHVYPEMGEEEFLDGVKQAWEKILPLIGSKQVFQQIGTKRLSLKYRADKAIFSQPLAHQKVRG